MSPVGMPSDPVRPPPGNVKAPEAPSTDRGTVRLVVTLIGILAVILCVGLILLTWREVDAASLGPIQTLAGAALGGLVALLVSTRSQ